MAMIPLEAGDFLLSVSDPEGAAAAADRVLALEYVRGRSVNEAAVARLSLARRNELAKAMGLLEGREITFAQSVGEPARGPRKE